MNENNITPESLSGGASVTPSDGEGAVSQEAVAFKDVVNEVLGKQFDSDETAIKSLKDTFSYVGQMGKARQAVQAVMAAKGVDEEGAIKLMEQIVSQAPEQKPEADMSKYVSREELENIRYYDRHPEYEAFKAVIDTIARAENKPVQEVVEMEAVKSLIGKAQSYDASEGSKSVLMSNPRLGQVTDTLSQAHDALREGNYKAAGDAAVKAVIDSMNA